MTGAWATCVQTKKSYIELKAWEYHVLRQGEIRVFAVGKVLAFGCLSPSWILLPMRLVCKLECETEVVGGEWQFLY